MSSEVCPFCKKSFKRLKSHLPHCKAAKPSKPTSPRHEETTISTSSSSSTPPPLRSAETEPSIPPKTLLGTKGNETLSKTPTQPSPVKKTRLKLSEKIKMATESSSPASKGKKKIPMSNQIEKESTGIYLEKIDAKAQPKSQQTNSLTKQNDKEEIDKTGMYFENQIFNQTAKKSTKQKTVVTSQTDSKKDLNDILTKKTGSTKEKFQIHTAKTGRRDDFWSEEENNERKLQENDIWTSRQDAKITLNDVRAALGRAKQNGRQKKSSNVVDELKREIVKPNGVQSALVGLKQEVPSQLMVLSGKSHVTQSKSRSFTSDFAKIERKGCDLTDRAEILKDGLRMDCLTMGLVARSSPAGTFLDAEVSTEAFRKDAASLLKGNVQTEEGRSDAKRRDQCSSRALSQRRFGQVTLRELPDWLVSRSPRRPRDALRMVQSGWQWYYRRYIDVKRGGVGGVAMLLAGYCVLSYAWAFPHLKHERWRKYH